MPNPAPLLRDIARELADPQDGLAGERWAREFDDYVRQTLEHSVDWRPLNPQRPRFDRRET